MDWSHLGTVAGTAGAGLISVGVVIKKTGILSLLKGGCPDKACQTTMHKVIGVVEKMDDKLSKVAEDVAYLKGKTE